MTVPSLAVAAGIGLAVFGASVGGTYLVLRWLRRHAVLDRPNDRSSHVVPTPRGGGLAVVPIIVLGWAASVVAGAAWPILLIPASIAGLLAMLCWRDDLKSLPIRIRLPAQILAVGIGLACLPGAGQVFQGWLPPILDLALSALLWVWFVNLYNFMDGIDGLTGMETAVIGIGLAVIGMAIGGAAPPLVLAAAALGFLVFNWPPARLFLGDVGSVPLGFLLGYLLLDLASGGAWAAALILPLYYLVDATVTLVRRMIRGEKFWTAHRQHFYQRAVQAGHGHGAVVLRILVANLALGALAVYAASHSDPSTGFACLALAAGIVAVLLAVLRRAPRRI
jgi:UDP-N-acetylmuramyl pentapeptide phosphotransferase/UDP-N-acetylglucosamine-1-phosphate transferase